MSLLRVFLSIIFPPLAVLDKGCGSILIVFLFHRIFAKNGGNVALGSDAGAWRVPHVEGLKTELSYLEPIVGIEHLKNSERMIREKFSRRY